MRIRSDIPNALALVLAPFLLAATPGDLVRVNAVFVPPPNAGGNGAVEARFTAMEPQIVVNKTPPPRLELEPGQEVLVDRQPPPHKGAIDPTKAGYLDLAKPVRFPVTLAPDVARGEHNLTATIIYYYCSKREGWCRKGRASVSLRVAAP